VAVRFSLTVPCLSSRYVREGPALVDSCQSRNGVDIMVK
jgi:hypothetical protein